MLKLWIFIVTRFSYVTINTVIVQSTLTVPTLRWFDNGPDANSQFTNFLTLSHQNDTYVTSINGTFRR